MIVHFYDFIIISFHILIIRLWLLLLLLLILLLFSTNVVEVEEMPLLSHFEFEFFIQFTLCSASISLIISVILVPACLFL